MSPRQAHYTGSDNGKGKDNTESVFGTFTSSLFWVVPDWQNVGNDHGDIEGDADGTRDVNVVCMVLHGCDIMQVI